MLLLLLAQSHSRPAAIFIDEFHPGLFEGLADDVIVHPRERCRARHELGAADGGDAHGTMVGEVFGAPTDERAGGPDLGTGQWRGWASFFSRGLL